MSGKKRTWGRAGIIMAVTALFFSAPAPTAQAAIDGLTGTTFNLTASAGHISTADGSTILVWGYGETGGTVQYPGPTLIVDQGETITVTLTNGLDVPASIVFPGHAVAATGGIPGLLTREAIDGMPVTYTFDALEPGTYLYNSGTQPDLQVEMGLIGALIVRPSATPIDCDGDTVADMNAYGDCRSYYDYEHLMLLTAMDLRVHDMVEQGLMSQVDTTDFFPVAWFINGRGGPDTLAPANAAWLPTQPYDALIRATPGDRVLKRYIGASRHSHPLHPHGNHSTVIARDGRLLESFPRSPANSRPAEVGTVPDLAVTQFTINVLSGATYDAIFTWTGQELGWDMHGHDDIADLFDLGGVDTTATEVFAMDTVTADASTTLTLSDGSAFPDHHPFRVIIWGPETDYATATNREVVTLSKTLPGADDFAATRAQEGTSMIDWGTVGGTVYMTDHGKDFPVTLPNLKDMTFGGFYSGSPYLGAAGFLPPGEGGLNPNAGFFFMWHSHNEKELTNNDIFPGGMLTMFVVEPPGTSIP